MKAVAITGPGQAGLAEAPDPEPKGEFVVVKVHAAPMCTEYKRFTKGDPGAGLGHEAVGEVAAIEAPGAVKAGDRVVVQPQTMCGECELCKAGDYIYCRADVDVRRITGFDMPTMAQYTIRQATLLTPIPEGMSYDHAGMALCGLGPTFGAAKAMNVGPDDTVLITGMGPVGLGGVINATHRGAGVIAVESNAYRADLARRLGAAEVLDPAGENVLEAIKDLTGGSGPGKCIDCSGAAGAQRLLIDAARAKGHVCFVGEAGELTIRVSNDMIRKGLRLEGVWHYNLNDAPAVMEIIRAEAEKIDMLLTHTFSIERVQEAFELQAAGECGKVVLHPWE